MTSDTTVKPCPECGKEWPENCEQSIAIELYGKCAYCLRFTSKVDFSKIQKIQRDRADSPKEK